MNKEQKLKITNELLTSTSKNVSWIETYSHTLSCTVKFLDIETSPLNWFDSTFLFKISSSELAVRLHVTGMSISFSVNSPGSPFT